MKQFGHPNMDGFICPICNTNADEPVVLVGIPGIEIDGIIECKQVHSECYRVYAKMYCIDVLIEE